ncbi:ankyrin repeat-containing domain protein [Hypoxylon rubiginosum]|uniref:Ankyrin repeat-containing domain protein n=1 Tax=Hypoxylon rubiginosum TaxID=110542 RepID=A0ACB9YL62_9PEZI|nr:ankyrin repeat-containing domain protein [Hypoxylon rubiginosum]
MISLHIAAIFGDEVITRCLLEDGYDLNIFEEVMRRPLFQTVAQSMRSIVELLLDYGTRIELADPGGINALHAALHQDTTDMLELLLQRDGDCNYQDLNFLTLLFRAVIDKKIEAARMLLKYNADPNIPDSTGFSPLFQCVATRDIPFVKLLLENGADPNAMVGMKQTTSVLPSESTTSTGNNNTNRPPIQHEFTCVPVRLQSQEADMSHSPISYAVRQGDEDLLKLLLSACENITWKDRRNFDEGLLHFAVRLGNNRIIDMPLEGGPEVLRNSTNGLGKTPLHIAAELGNMEAARLGWDDGLIFVATVLVVALLALSISVRGTQVKTSGCHKRDIFLPENTLLKLLLAFNVLYLVAACFTKLSALYLYIRIFTQKKKFQKTCKALVAIVVILYIAVLIQEFTVSGIAVQLWNKQNASSIVDKRRVDLGTAFYRNVVILILPIPLVWKLQMSIMKKINLTALFLSGLSVTVVASFRLMAIVRADYDNEVVSVTSGIMNLQVLEPELAIFCLCLPVLNRFWLDLWEKCFGRRKQLRQTHQMSGGNSHDKREGEEGHLRWDEFLRSGNYTPYSASAGVGTPTATASRPGRPRPRVRRPAGDRGEDPGQSASLPEPPPINVDTTWSIAYEATAAMHL